MAGERYEYRAGRRRPQPDDRPHVRLPALVAGQVLRATDAALTPGGKAVNVCRAAMTLGAPARLVGPFPGRLGGVAAELLDAEGLAVTAVPVDW